MRRFMMLAGLALVASLAMAGAVATSAFAVAPEIKLGNGATFPQPFSVASSEVSTLADVGVITVTCSSLLGSGTLQNSKDALLLLLWHGCKENAGNSCESAGEPAGLIHALVLALPVWLDKGQTVPGLLFERHQGNSDIAHFKCLTTPTTLVLVKGTVLGHITKPAVKTLAHALEVEVLVKTVGTQQEFEHPEEIAALTDKLEVSLNGGTTFTPATEEVKKAVAEFTTAGVEAEFV